MRVSDWSGTVKSAQKLYTSDRNYKADQKEGNGNERKTKTAFETHLQGKRVEVSGLGQSVRQQYEN